MGSGIAEVAARSGCDVILCEVSDIAAENALARIRKSLGRAERSGKLSAADREAAEGRLRVVADVAELADRDLVVEAVVEDEAEKTVVFQAVSKVVRPDCLLASNTSSIPIMKLAAASEGPERVIGLHFFNPVPVLPLVELVPSLLTSPETLERARAFATDRLGKQTVLSKDRAGFVVNALLIPYVLASIRMVESGFASAEDVDTAMVAGCAHPMGPLALADLIGLDTTAAVAASMYAEFKEPLYAPPPLLLRMVEAGLLGRKAGRGFFDYRRPKG
jgi:3-hydroxybutyryl-CoA dehydrogenase